MKGGARLYWGIAAAAGLLALAGCGHSFMQFGGGERQSWRHEAEVQCLKARTIKDTPSVVQISPIEGPGMCGADFPLKVAALGEGTAYGYGDEVRPPAPVSSMPRWPVRDGGTPPPQHYGAPPRNLDAPMRIVPVTATPGAHTPGIDDYVLQGSVQGSVPMRPAYAPPNAPDYPVRYEAPRAIHPQYTPPQAGDDVQSDDDDIPDDAILPNRNRPAPPRQTYRSPPDAPLTTPSAPRYQPPKLGPARPMPVTAVKATVSPPATLACPIVSALDKWVSEGVQPAALRWFKQPVVEIKQISSYSCRAMVGAGTGNISEHAFGNALDIAGFVLADGRTVLVKTGWNGRPEEAGFLHDVQGAACDTFTTVLAPGYNVYHYDHIHVDLMRRSSGRHPCRPDAIPGEVAAARQLQKSKYAHRGDPGITGSIAKTPGKSVVAGEDGEFDDDD
jgi:hypothetical protein